MHLLSSALLTVLSEQPLWSTRGAHDAVVTAALPPSLHVMQDLEYLQAVSVGTDTIPSPLTTASLDTVTPRSKFRMPLMAFISKFLPGISSGAPPP